MIEKTGLETSSYNQLKILVISPTHTKLTHWKNTPWGLVIFSKPKSYRIGSERSWLQGQGAAVSGLEDRR